MWKWRHRLVIRPEAKEHLEPPVTGRSKDSPLEPLEGVQPHQLLISDFWTPELTENIFLLFYATKFVVICYISHRALTK